jgi:hypothetical protein
MCLLRYGVGAYGDGDRLSLNRLDSQVHAHMSRNLRAIEHTPSSRDANSYNVKRALKEKKEMKLDTGV